MRTLVIAGALFLTVSTSNPAQSEEAKKASFRPTGVRAAAGLVFPENAENSLGLGASVNMGTLFKPWLHASVGATRWSADIDRSQFASDARGSMSDVRVYIDLGLEPFVVGGVEPYFDLGLAMHSVSASVPNDASLQAALEGSNVGVEVAVGVASTAGLFRLSAELRREFVDDVDNWSMMFGIGTRWDAKKKEVDEETGR